MNNIYITLQMKNHKQFKEKNNENINHDKS
jgi:hypothetical protein